MFDAHDIIQHITFFSNVYNIDMPFETFDDHEISKVADSETIVLESEI